MTPSSPPNHANNVADILNGQRRRHLGYQSPASVRGAIVHTFVYFPIGIDLKSCTDAESVDQHRR